MALETLAERIEKLEEYQKEGLRWISNIAAHLQRMDRRIEQNERMLEEMRAARQNGTVHEYPCPIAGCPQVFYGTRGGWDGHVGSPRMHPDWHPGVTDSEERRRLFKQDYAAWFSAAPKNFRMVL